MTKYYLTNEFRVPRQDRNQVYYFAGRPELLLNEICHFQQYVHLSSPAHQCHCVTYMQIHTLVCLILRFWSLSLCLSRILKYPVPGDQSSNVPTESSNEKTIAMNLTGRIKILKLWRFYSFFSLKKNILKNERI